MTWIQPRKNIVCAVSEPIFTHRHDYLVTLHNKTNPGDGSSVSSPCACCLRRTLILLADRDCMHCGLPGAVETEAMVAGGRADCGRPVVLIDSYSGRKS